MMSSILRCLRAWVGGSLCVTLGCSAENTNDYTQGMRSDGAVRPPALDAGDAESEPVDGSSEVCVPEPVSECAEDVVVDACTTPPNSALGAVTGRVVLAKGVRPGAAHAARGDLRVLVIAEFDLTSCPDDPNPALPVALTVLHCADLTDEKSVSFTIEGIALREEPYLLVPFLDVNVDSEPNPQPLDACDLISLPTPVVVNEPKLVELAMPLELTMNASILQTTCGLGACK